MSSAQAKKISKVKHKELYRPFPCRLESIQSLTPMEKLFKLVRADNEIFDHKPGQFMQVSIFGYGEAPISVSSSVTRGDYLELCVHRAGKLTGAMHDDLKSGDLLGLRGPFGSSFDTELMKGKDLILISGGCGLAPMRALIQHIEDTRDQFGDVTIIYGAKTPDAILYHNELKQWKEIEHFKCHITVDNVPDSKQWHDNVGLITTLIPSLNIDADKTIAVVVGPPVMYKFVIQELNIKGITNDNIIVSLERYMKCGVGKCGHCAIEHLYCCLDGPVFRLSEVINLKGAL